MPLTVSISAGQSLGVPSIIVITDTSTGTDATVTNRKVYLRTSTNQYLTEVQQSSSTVSFTNWPISDGATINLDVLTEASTLEVTVVWTTGAGTTVYELTDVITFYQSGLYISVRGFSRPNKFTGGTARHKLLC